VKVFLSFVPPGGGEVDYEAEFELPGVPQQGDYISIVEPEGPGTRDFIVRRTWWGLKFADRGEQPGTLRKLVAECEFALSGGASESHKRACEGYKRGGRPIKEFDESCY